MNKTKREWFLFIITIAVAAAAFLAVAVLSTLCLFGPKLGIGVDVRATIWTGGGVSLLLLAAVVALACRNFGRKTS